MCFIYFLSGLMYIKEPTWRHLSLLMCFSYEKETLSHIFSRHFQWPLRVLRAAYLGSLVLLASYKSLFSSFLDCSSQATWLPSSFWKEESSGKPSIRWTTTEAYWKFCLQNLFLGKDSFAHYLPATTSAQNTHFPFLFFFFILICKKKWGFSN